MKPEIKYMRIWFPPGVTELKAGTPIDEDGCVTDNENAYGVLKYDIRFPASKVPVKVGGDFSVLWYDRNNPPAGVDKDGVFAGSGSVSVIEIVTPLTDVSSNTRIRINGGELSPVFNYDSAEDYFRLTDTETYHAIMDATRKPTVVFKTVEYDEEKEYEMTSFNVNRNNRYERVIIGGTYSVQKGSE